MALTLQCDGCGTAIPVDTPGIGRLFPVFYCPGCDTVWRGFEAAQDTERAACVTAFEAWRRSHLAGLRQQLAHLPDE